MPGHKPGWEQGSQSIGEISVEGLRAGGGGFPDGSAGKEPACQCRRHKRCEFDSWVGKIP